MLGTELSWDGITEVSLQEAWVVGDRKTKAFQAPKSACVGTPMGGKAWWA